MSGLAIAGQVFRDGFADELLGSPGQHAQRKLFWEASASGTVQFTGS